MFLRRRSEREREGERERERERERAAISLPRKHVSILVSATHELHVSSGRTRQFGILDGWLGDIKRFRPCAEPRL